MYKNIFREHANSEKVADKFGIPLTLGHMKCLVRDNWLNDSVINFYLRLITERVMEEKVAERLDHHRAYVNGCMYMTGRRLAGHSYPRVAIG